MDHGNKPNVIFLAAAKVGGILANDNYPADFLYDNLMIQTNVIRLPLGHASKNCLSWLIMRIPEVRTSANYRRVAPIRPP